MRALLPVAKAVNDVTSEGTVQDKTGAYASALRRPDGLELYMRDYSPPEGVKAQALLVMVHGGGWHSGYFSDFVHRLVKQGAAVVTYDLRGHGLSGLVDGLRCYVNTFQDHIDDCLAVLQTAQLRHAGLPTFFFGESFGASVLLSLLALRPDEPSVKSVRGYMLSGPLIGIPTTLLPPSPVLTLVQCLSWLAPKTVIPGSSIEATFDSAFVDKETADAARADPLVDVSGGAYIRPMASFMRAQHFISLAKELTIPFLIIHGDKDYRIPVQSSVAYHEESAAKDKTLLRYEEAHHMMLQETDTVKARTMQDFCNWLLEHAPVASGK